MDIKDLFMILGFVLSLVVAIYGLNGYRESKQEQIKKDLEGQQLQIKKDLEAHLKDLWGAVDTLREANANSHTKMIDDYRTLLTQSAVMQEKILNHAEINNKVNENLNQLNNRQMKMEKVIVKIAERLKIETNGNGIG